MTPSKWYNFFLGVCQIFFLTSLFTLLTGRTVSWFTFLSAVIGAYLVGVIGLLINKIFRHKSKNN